MTKFMEDLKKTMEEGRYGKVSPNTVKTYLSALKTLNGKKEFEDLEFLKNTDKIQGIIKPYSLSYRKTLLVAIMSVLKNVDTMNKEFLFYTKLFNEVIDEKPVQGMTDKQRENNIIWTDVLKRKDEIRNQAKKDETKIPMYFLMSLYTDLPPRRSLDYTDMFIVRDYTKHNKDEEERVGNENRKNYLSLNEQKLIFNNYKTHWKYGTQVMDFSDNVEFKKALKIYLKYRGINLRTIRVGDVFPLLVNKFMEFLDTPSKLTKQFYEIFDGRHFSTSMMRHSYITHEFGDQFEKMEYVADAMGHSNSQQRAYNFIL